MSRYETVDYLTDDACREFDLRQIEEQIRKIESDNNIAALARGTREMQHDNYIMGMWLVANGVVEEWPID